MNTASALNLPVVSLQLEASAVGPRRAGEHAYGICITRQVRFQNKFVVARIKAEYTSGRGDCAGGCIKSGRRTRLTPNSDRAWLVYISEEVVTIKHVGENTPLPLRH